MEWIKCQNTLPAYGKRVLVVAVKEFENGHIDYYVDVSIRTLTNEYGEHWHNLDRWDVRYWAPLPEPPKQ